MMFKIFKKIKSIFDFLMPNESITNSKEKWDSLAQENAKYYIFSDQGTGISEEEFQSAGEADYKNLILNDLLLKEKISTDSKVLEIGCGTGRMTEFFAKSFGSVYGIDISGEMIEQARNRLGGGIKT